MNIAMFKFVNKLAVLILFIIGLLELTLALWTVLEDRYRSLAYTLADVGYIDLWTLRYLSMCLFASAIITLVMCLILVWGVYSTSVFIFISSTMIVLVIIAEFTMSIVTFANRFPMRLTLQEQLPKLVITYRQGNDERANRALDILQSSYHCCGSDGRLSYQNNVPLSCNMYSVGCLIRTMLFLDYCMDALAIILLVFSLIKSLIVIYLYSFLCLYQRHKQKHPKASNHLITESSRWRHSSSLDSSSSVDNIPKKVILPSSTNTEEKMIKHESDCVEKRHIVFNEYDSQISNKKVQNAAVIQPPPPPLPPPSSLSLSLVPMNIELSTPLGDQQMSRKLSCISERTEKTETDDSEPDLLRAKQHNAKRPAIITLVPSQKLSQQTLPPPPPLPKKLPIIKNRRTNHRDDENDHDSGVEHSPSEKSFEDQNTNKRHSDALPLTDADNTKSKPVMNKTTVKSPPTLSFSNVFVTSISQSDITEQSHSDDIKKPLTSSSSPSSSSSFSDHLLLTEVALPKPILKKSNHQSSSPSSDQDRIPPSYHDQKKFSSVINPKSYVKINEPHSSIDSTVNQTVHKQKRNCHLHNIPKPAPRSSLKQSTINRHEESLV